MTYVANYWRKAPNVIFYVTLISLNILGYAFWVDLIFHLQIVDAHVISGRDHYDVSAVYHSRLFADMAIQAQDSLGGGLSGIAAGDGAIIPKKFGSNCKLVLIAASWKIGLYR